MKVTNVKKDEIFKMLGSGKEVYVIESDTDELTNLHYEAVSTILEKVQDTRNAFFILESED